MLLDMAAMERAEKAIAAKQAPEHGDVLKLVSACELGKTLYLKHLVNTTSDSVRDLIVRAVDKWVDGSEQLTKASFENFRRATMVALQELAGVDQLPSRMKVSMTYRGVPITITISQLVEAVECRAMAVVKTIAVGQEKLAQLPLEAAIVAARAPSSGRRLWWSPASCVRQWARGIC
jgi:hypothetical protein